MNAYPQNQPAEIQLERAMTSTLIESPESLIKIAPLLDRLMFLDVRNFKAIDHARSLLDEELFTRSNLEVRLERDGIQNVAKYFADLDAATTASSDFPKHYKEWLDPARLRYSLRCEAELLEKPMSVDELFARKNDILETARNLGKAEVGVQMSEASELGKSWLSNMREAQKSGGLVTTGIPIIDEALIGLMPGTLSTLAARPGGGKTTMALDWAIRNQKNGLMLINTLEMAPHRLAIKASAMANGDNSMAYERSFLADEPEFDAVKVLLDRANTLRLHFLCTSDIYALESAILALKPALVIYDFLQLTMTPREFAGKRHEFIGELARKLQRLALRRNVPILALAQLNRDADGGAATTANLKDSSVIEEASDNLLFLEKPNQNAEGCDAFRRVLTVKKARSGIEGDSVELMLSPESGQFEPWNTIKAAQLAETRRRQRDDAQ